MKKKILSIIGLVAFVAVVSLNVSLLSNNNSDFSDISLNGIIMTAQAQNESTNTNEPDPDDIVLDGGHNYVKYSDLNYGERDYSEEDLTWNDVADVYHKYMSYFGYKGYTNPDDMNMIEKWQWEERRERYRKVFDFCHAAADHYDLSGDPVYDNYGIVVDDCDGKPNICA